MIEETRIALLQRIETKAAVVDQIRAGDMEAASAEYVAASTQSRNLYSIRSGALARREMESSQNRAQRIAADLAKAAAKDVMDLINAERASAASVISADKAAVMGPGTAEDQLTEILSRYPA